MPNLYFNEYIPSELSLPESTNMQLNVLPELVPLKTINFDDIDIDSLVNSPGKVKSDNEKNANNFFNFYKLPETDSTEFKLAEGTNIVPFSASALEPYYFSNDYKELGYLPGKNLTNLYEANSSGWDTFSDWMPALGQRILKAFTGNATQSFRNIAALSNLEFNEFWNTEDAKAADEEEQRFRITHPTLNYSYDDRQNSNLKYIPFLRGSGSFYRNFIPELGFTIGTIAYSVGENLLLDSLTGGSSTGYEAVKGTKDVYNALRNLTNASRFLQNAQRVINTANSSERVISGLKSAYYGYNALRGAMAEASMEGGQAYISTRKNLIEQFKNENGYDPNASDLEKIDEFAIKAGNSTFALNVPVLMASNLIQYKSLLWPRSAIEKAASQSTLRGINLAIEGAGTEQRIVRAASTGWDKTKRVLDNLRFLSEGGEEISQLAASKFSESYYSSLYNGMASDKAMSRALSQARDGVFSREGFENFFGGLMGGAIFQGIGAASSRFGLQDRLSNITRGVIPQSQRSTKQQKEEQINALIEALNRQGPNSFINKNFANQVLQGEIAENINQILTSSNNKNYFEEHSKALREFLYSGIVTGKLDFRLDQLNQLKTLSDEDFATAIGQEVTPELRGKFNEAIDNVISKAETFQKNYSRVQNTFKGISFEDKLKFAVDEAKSLRENTNSTEEELDASYKNVENALIQREAFEMAKKDLTFSLSDIENSAKDLDAYYTRFNQTYYPTSNLSVDELDSLVDSKKRQKLKSDLRNDISSLKQTVKDTTGEDKKTYEQELKEKIKQLELLSSEDFSSNLTGNKIYNYFEDSLKPNILQNGLLESEVIRSFDELVELRDRYNKSIGTLDFMTRPKKITNGNFNREIEDIINTGDFNVPAGFKQMSQYHYYALKSLKEDVERRSREYVEQQQALEINPTNTNINTTVESIENTPIETIPTTEDRIKELRDRLNIKGQEASFELAKLAVRQGIDLQLITKEEYANFAAENLYQLDEKQFEQHRGLRVVTTESERSSIIDSLIQSIPQENIDSYNTYINNLKSLAKGDLAERLIFEGIRILPETKNSSEQIIFGINAAEDNLRPLASGYEAKFGTSKFTPELIQSLLESLQGLNFDGRVIIYQDLLDASIKDHQIKILATNDQSQVKIVKDLLSMLQTENKGLSYTEPITYITIADIKNPTKKITRNTEQQYVFNASNLIQDNLTKQIDDLEQEEDEKIGAISLEGNVEENPITATHISNTKSVGDSILENNIDIDGNFNFVVEDNSVYIINPSTGNKLDDTRVELTNDEIKIFEANNLQNSATKKSANQQLIKSVYNRIISSYSAINNPIEEIVPITLEEATNQINSLTTEEDVLAYFDQIPNVDIIDAVGPIVDKRLDEIEELAAKRNRNPLINVKDSNGRIEKYSSTQQFSFDNKIWNIDIDLTTINGELNLQNSKDSSEKIRINDLNSVSLYTPSNTNETKLESNSNLITNLDEILRNNFGRVNIKGVSFDTFDVVIDRDTNTAEVGNVKKTNPTTDKGIGFKAYVELGTRLAANGITLVSSSTNARNQDGVNLWNRLVKEGYAIGSNSQGYTFINNIQEEKQKDINNIGKAGARLVFNNPVEFIGVAGTYDATDVTYTGEITEEGTKTKLKTKLVDTSYTLPRTYHFTLTSNPKVTLTLSEEELIKNINLKYDLLNTNSSNIEQTITNTMTEQEQEKVAQNIENVDNYLKENADTIINEIGKTNSEDAAKNFFDSTCK